MGKRIVKVILTSSGSQVAPSLINMMRKSSRYDVKVIGVDAGAKDRLVGVHFCDRFYTVPFAYDKGYIAAMLNICKKEKPALIFPASDEEAMALSANRDDFGSLGVKIASSSASSVKMCIDKFRLMSYLKQKGISVAGFCALENFSDLRKAAKRLGYPGRRVVIKPRVGRGSKGVRIIEEGINLYEKFLKNEFYASTIDEIEQVFKDNENRLKEFFMMEYLDKDRYSVDILTEKSSPAVCVCRRKIFPVNSPTQIADIVFDKDIIGYAKKIAVLLRFDYFVQIEAGRDNDGTPSLIEINPRLDATIPIAEGTGINYFEQMIHYALNGKFFGVKKKKQHRLRFFRYWQHIFTPLHPVLKDGV